uniref:Prolactin 2 n=1 Tax=Oncorhynchus mykiss TaxID=8022 RepID=A0A8C7VXE7_ONCMY
WLVRGSLWALLMVLLCVELRGSGSASAAPICVHGQAGCHFLSLADLFDRVIQHSARMHSISSDLHSEFEQYVLPSRNHIGRINRHCHTATILTPNGKENAQRLMQHLGMISNSLSGLSSPEALDTSSDTSGESQAMSDHDLLYCFRRDSNKVQNYLKILKCRIVPENGC